MHFLLCLFALASVAFNIQPVQSLAPRAPQYTGGGHYYPVDDDNSLERRQYSGGAHYYPVDEDNSLDKRQYKGGAHYYPVDDDNSLDKRETCPTCDPTNPPAHNGAAYAIEEDDDLE